MRIEPSNTFTPPPAVATGPEGGSKVTSLAAAAGGAGGAAAAGGFSPTSDLARLIALVKAAPEVRADVVTELLERTAAGELQTRTAATDTAAALLDAG